MEPEDIQWVVKVDLTDRERDAYKTYCREHRTTISALVGAVLRAALLSGQVEKLLEGQELPERYSRDVPPYLKRRLDRIKATSTNKPLSFARLVDAGTDSQELSVQSEPVEPSELPEPVEGRDAAFDKVVHCWTYPGEFLDSACQNLLDAWALRWGAFSEGESERLNTAMDLREKAHEQWRIAHSKMSKELAELESQPLQLSSRALRMRTLQLRSRLREWEVKVRWGERSWVLKNK